MNLRLYFLSNCVDVLATCPVPPIELDKGGYEALKTGVRSNWANRPCDAWGGR